MATWVASMDIGHWAMIGDGSTMPVRRRRTRTVRFFTFFRMFGSFLFDILDVVYVLSVNSILCTCMAMCLLSSSILEDLMDVGGLLGKYVVLIYT